MTRLFDDLDCYLSSKMQLDVRRFVFSDDLSMKGKTTEQDDAQYFPCVCCFIDGKIKAKNRVSLCDSLI